MISTVDRLRLAALLGMLGSSHGGDRDNAAQLLEQFRRQRGFNWADLLAPRPLNNADPVQAGPRVCQAAGGWDRDPIYALPQRSRSESVWRWSMPLAIAAIGMMSLTLLARQHAMEKLIGVDPDGRCASGMEAVGPVGCLPAAANHPSGGLETAAPAAAMADVMPGPFAQGLADRKVYET